MYSVDDRDQVMPLTDIPQSSVGAPIPLILSNEGITVVAFYLSNMPEAWDGKSVRILNEDSADEPIALIRFSGCYATMFGPPNDEAFSGHPLAVRGLRPYGAFIIEDSSWLRQLEVMNSVHPYHNSQRFWQRKHFVVSFHDSTFECIADAYSIEVHQSSINQIVPRMLDLLGRDF